MSFELRSLWESAGGQVPQDWSLVPLEALLRDNKSIAVGVMYPGEHTPGGVPLIKVGDIKDGGISDRPAYCISAETNQEYKRTQLLGDELLITLVGNPGECVVVKPEMAGWNPARAIAVIKLKDVELRTYLKAVLESSAGKHLIDSVLNTTVQKTLNLKDIRRLPIPMPDKAVITGISQMSELLSNRITLLRETNATLEAIAQALFKSWFVDFDPVRAKMEGRMPEGMDEATAALFPDGFEETELGEVPRGWRVGSILNVATLLSGGTPKTDRSEFWGGEILWASAKDVSQATDSVLLGTERTITEAGLAGSSTKLIPAYATAVVARGATTGRLVMFGKEMAMNQTCYALVSRHQTPVFLSLLLRWEMGKLIKAAHGSVFDTITTSTFESFVCRLPPEPICTQFEKSARPIFEKIVANVAQAQLLSKLRDTLLPRLISGQLRLPDAQLPLEATDAL